MKEFYNKLWENTKTWKFDPAIFIINMITLHPNLFFVGINFFVIIVYAGNNKYLKKFFIKTILWLIFFTVIAVVLCFPVIFIMGFDDAGSLSSEERGLMFDGMKILISVLKIIYSLISAIIFQNYKKLIEKENN